MQFDVVHFYSAKYRLECKPRRMKINFSPRLKTTLIQTRISYHINFWHLKIKISMRYVIVSVQAVIDLIVLRLEPPFR